MNFTITFVTPEAAIRAALITVSIGVVISASEDLTTKSVFSNRGVLSWRVLQVTQPAPRLLVFRRVRDWLFMASGCKLLLLAKAGAAITIVAVAAIAPGRKVALLALCATVLGSLVLLRRRTTYGLDGSDDMMTVIFLACTVFFATPNGSLAQMTAAMYIAVQSVLSYSVSGVAKLASSNWRRGESIAGVLNTTIYGNATVGSFLFGRRWLGHLLCWAVIAFECLFVSTLFISDTRILYASLCVGALFHASTAVLMGLNGFFWTFTATYPAVILANHVINRGLA